MSKQEKIKIRPGETVFFNSEKERLEWIGKRKAAAMAMSNLVKQESLLKPTTVILQPIAGANIDECRSEAVALCAGWKTDVIFNHNSQKYTISYTQLMLQVRGHGPDSD